MRVFIELPAETWERLCVVADQQYRPPRKQLELIVMQALTGFFAAEDGCEKEVAVHADET
jgi:hypothetical protein